MDTLTKEPGPHNTDNVTHLDYPDNLTEHGRGEREAYVGNAEAERLRTGKRKRSQHADDERLDTANLEQNKLPGGSLVSLKTNSPEPKSATGIHPEPWSDCNKCQRCIKMGLRCTPETKYIPLLSHISISTNIFTGTNPL